MSRISRASRGSSDSLLASQRPPVDRVKLRGLKRRALTYDARLAALAREVKETEALLRIERNKRDARSHAAERARKGCLLYTSPSPRDATLSRMPSSA